jgi:type IV secretory pathway protease TraF
LINEGLAGTTLGVDRSSRPLTPWWGCRALEPGEVFLLNDGSTASFDGRYFGPSRASDIVGKLAPLWTF